MDSLLNNINSILDVHAPLKKVNKYKLKFKTKPWITPALQNTISIKNNSLLKFITAKDYQVKERYQKEYKDYQVKKRYQKEYKDYINMLSTILKQSKTNYYNHYFKNNRNRIKNTWKGLKSILYIKNISPEIPKTLTVDDTNISNPVEI